MKRLLLHSTLATIFVFLVLGAVYKVSQLSIFNAFDPIGQAVSDMELTDVTFSKLRDEPSIDTTIVIVNVGNLSRSEIAQEIMNINQFHPKMIGIDAFFDCPGGLRDSVDCPQANDVMGNTLLRMAIAGADNVVMVTKLLQTDSLLKANGGDADIYDSLEHTDDYIRGNAMEGYANLETDAANQEDLKTCRTYNPSIEVSGKQELAFATKLAMLYDSAKTEKFLARNNPSEVINYRGNVLNSSASYLHGRFYCLDANQALDLNSFTPGLFKGKIVLMGYLGNSFGDVYSTEDKFFTPLNVNYAGKSRPDMFGVVVHANIISMILNEDYVNELQDWQKKAIAIVVCFLNVALFWIITRRIPDWFDGLSILFQTVQFLVYSALVVFFFKWFSLKLDITSTLAVTAVVGTCFEMYYNVLLVIWARIRDKIWFTRKGDGVLTPEEHRSING